MASPKEVELSLEELRSNLDYNQKTGIFTWLKSGRGIAGCLHSNGYIIIGLNYHQYAAHRLAWFYVYGEWPSLLDHKNRKKHDNRLANLRIATKSQNHQNSKPKRPYVRWPFKKMKVGDSFIVPSSLVRSIYTAASKYGKRNNVKLVLRKGSDGCHRCSRTK